MKKFILLLAVATLAFASCSKDDDGIGQFDFDKELLYGSWAVTHWGDHPWNFEATSNTFYRDGTYFGTGIWGTGSGTYKVAGRRITTYVDGEMFMYYDVISIEGKTCVLLPGNSITQSKDTLTCEKLFDL